MQAEKSHKKCLQDQQRQAYTKGNRSSQVQLQVNISIGKNKFLLQVEKCSNLHEQVLIFLKQNNINLKYEGPILAMVREQLSKKQLIKQDRHDKEIEQLKIIKQQMDNMKKKKTRQADNEKVRMKEQLGCASTKQNKQNYGSEYNSMSKHGVSTESPGQSYAQSKVREIGKDLPNEQGRCQDVYERWKQKQKVKQNEKQKNKNSNPNDHIKVVKTNLSNKSFIKDKEKTIQHQVSLSKQKSKSNKKLQTHSPDYFYNKGQKFKQAKQTHIGDLFKERYPFQLYRETSLTATKKIMLHQRLFNEHKVKQHSKMQKQISEQKVQREQKVVDKYKRKVIERDNKINEALGYLISNKMIVNPCKIETVPKSPFRRTNFN